MGLFLLQIELCLFFCLFKCTFQQNDGKQFGKNFLAEKIQKNTFIYLKKAKQIFKKGLI
jgi:hypothetical protein